MSPLPERALRLTRPWFDDTTVTRVIEPLVADWAHERAVPSGLARLRADAAWTLRLAHASAISAVRAFAQPMPVALRREAATLAATYTAVGVLLVVALGVVKGQLVVTPHLLPSVLASALLMAPLPVAALLLADRQVAPHLSRWALVRTVALCVVLAAAGMEWVVPEANMAYRRDLNTAVGTAAPTRGPREMPTSELFDSGRVVVSRGVRIERHHRFAVLLWPPTLAAVGAALAALWGRRRVVAATAALGTAVLAAMALSVEATLPSATWGVARAWVPPLCYAAVAVMLSRLTRARARRRREVTA